MNGNGSQGGSSEGDLSAALQNQLGLITSLSGAMQQAADVQAPSPMIHVPPYLQSYGTQDALGMMLMMQHMHMQQAFMQNMAQQNAEEQRAPENPQVTPLANRILASEERHHVKEYNPKTMKVPARQRSNATRVARGPEKKLTFLLPHTPVDSNKYENIDQKEEEEDLAVAEALVSGAQTAVTPGSIRYTSFGDRGRIEHTPEKVASTPMAIEVLSQLYSQQIQHDYLARQPQDVERIDDSHPSRSKKSRRSAASTRAKPSTAAIKAARAASLAVARPKKVTNEGIKTCNCKRSQCLKMYCECFAASGYCAPGCSCESCKNTEDNVDLVNIARAGILMKDPTAFDEKVDKADGHKKGCRCKRSKCLKKYCECYNAGVKCNPAICQCVGCHNSDYGSEDDPREQPDTVPVGDTMKPGTNGQDVHVKHDGVNVHGEGFNVAVDATQKSTQEEITLMEGVLKEINGNYRNQDTKETSASALVSHIQEHTTQPQLDEVDTATSPTFRVKGTKARRITNISAVTAPSKENEGSISKRPKRAASTGVSGAIAAAKLGLGFDSKWDMITPPVKIKSNTNKNSDLTQMHGDTDMPFENSLKNYPKKKDAKLLLLEALEQEKAAMAAHAEVDALSALVNLHSK